MKNRSLDNEKQARRAITSKKPFNMKNRSFDKEGRANTSKRYRPGRSLGSKGTGPKGYYVQNAPARRAIKFKRH
jgi:hypothetical protein